MKKSKIIKLSVLILTVLFVLISVFMISRYVTASRLCEQIQAGEEIDTNFSNGYTAPRFLINITDVMQIQGPKIPLVEACYYRNVQAVSVLLENGADPNICFPGHFNALEAALVFGPFDEKSYEIVMLLLEHGADINGYGSDEPISIWLSRWIGYGNNNPDVQELLLYLLDNGGACEQYGFNYALFCAVRSGNVDLTKHMIETYGYDVNDKNDKGQTTLIFAVERATTADSCEMISLLIDKGADLNVKDDDGHTAYDYALQNGCNEIIELLDSQSNGGTS